MDTDQIQPILPKLVGPLVRKVRCILKGPSRRLYLHVASLYLKVLSKNFATRTTYSNQSLIAVPPSSTTVSSKMISTSMKPKTLSTKHYANGISGMSLA